MAKSKADIEHETLDRVMHKLRTKGIESAVDALVAVCDDPKAAAPAKSAAGAALLRANGLFGEKPGGGPRKPSSEMSPEELNEALDQLRAELAVKSRDDSGEGGQGGTLFD